MKNSNTSEMIALAMKENIESEDMKTLFYRDYVKAHDEKCDEDCKDEHKDEHKEHCGDEMDADDADVSFAHDSEDEEECNSADDGSLALQAAVASLLTASAALDEAGFEKTASLSLKLATFVSEAKKKKDMKKSKDSKDSKKSTKDSKDSKKSDKKKDSKKSGKNPFAKKKDTKKDSKDSKSKASSKK
jgi:hypothetical protein